MTTQLLNSQQAAQKLGISALTLYDWLAKSNAGEFALRGQPFTIEYLQGGAKGQGRIQIEAAELERLQAAMRVRSRNSIPRPTPATRRHYPGITVPLGRPKE